MILDFGVTTIDLGDASGSNGGDQPTIKSPSQIVADSYAEVQQFYHESGQRFIIHFRTLAHDTGEDLRPQLRWERSQQWSREPSGPDLQDVEKRAITVLGQEHPNLLYAVGLAHRLQQWNHVCHLAEDLAVYFDIGSYWSDWVHIAELAVEDARRTVDSRLEAEALNYLGVVYRRLERLSEATDCTQRSLNLYRSLGDRYGEGLALGNLGGVQVVKNDFRASLKYYEAALQVFQELDDQYGQAQSHMGIGISLSRLRDLDQAISNLEACLNIQRAIGDRFGEAQTLNNLSIVQRRQGKIPEAIANLQASLEIKRELGDRQGIALALNNLAVAYQEASDLDQAVVAWEEALILLNSLHSPTAKRVADRLTKARNKRRNQQRDTPSTG